MVENENRKWEKKSNKNDENWPTNFSNPNLGIAKRRMVMMMAMLV